jgi:hypothetical protein
MDAYPLLSGGKKETVACPFPATADTFLGAVGTVFLSGTLFRYDANSFGVVSVAPFCIS